MVKTFIITGDTYCCRQNLHELGGRWVPHLHAWLVPGTEHESVVRLRKQIGFDVRLVTLPVDLPYTTGKRLARNRAAPSSRLSSPTAP